VSEETTGTWRVVVQTDSITDSNRLLYFILDILFDLNNLDARIESKLGYKPVFIAALQSMLTNTVHVVEGGG
jgi:hypothetical protein